MRGSFDRARELVAGADEAAAELGQTLWLAAGGMAAWEVETLAGDFAKAATEVRRSCALLEEIGERGHRSLATGQLAESLYSLGELAEAERWTQVSEELSTPDDVSSQMRWRQVRAKLLARAGEHAEAETMARAAVSRAAGTDMINWHAGALVDLAEPLSIAGRYADAAAALDK